MGNLVDVLSEFFNYFIAQIDSLINIFMSLPGLYGFLNYVYYLCIPNEITGIISVIFMFFVLVAILRHSK